MHGYLKNVLEQPVELERTLKDLLTNKITQLDQIGQILNQAQHIVLTSMGSAHNSLMPMYNALLREGKYVSLLESSEVLHSHLYLDDPDTVFLLMSRSGESREINDMVRLLNKTGKTSIGITMTRGSTLDRYATLSLLDVCSFDEMICLKAYSSLALCGLVCVAYMKGDSVDLNAYIQMFHWMQENQETISSQMAQIPFYKNAHSYVFLSRDYGIGCCKAASLWLEEIAFVSGDVSSIDAFYHGPVRSIFSSSLAENTIVPVYLDVMGDERSDRIWRETSASAKESIYIGNNPQAPGSQAFVFPHFSVTPEANALLLCLYTQLLAYHCCVVKGYTPGISLGIPEDRWVVS